MALPLAVLIAALAAPHPAPPAVGATPSPPAACVACHGSHYAAQGTCTGCHRGDARTTRPGIAHEGLLTGAAAAWNLPGVTSVREGEALRETLGCRRCHQTGGQGNALAIALDDVVWKRSQAELRASLQHPVTAMPDFGLSVDQADELIAVLLRDGSRAEHRERYQVRFRAGAAAGRNPFEVRCGGCHRALTPAGALGTGSSGPNLSGLLTRWFPASDGRPWTPDRLERWLRNPRAERGATTMQPVVLEPGELDRIVELLGPGAAR